MKWPCKMLQNLPYIWQILKSFIKHKLLISEECTHNHNFYCTIFLFLAHTVIWLININNIPKVLSASWTSSCIWFSSRMELLSDSDRLGLFSKEFWWSSILFSFFTVFSGFTILLLSTDLVLWKNNLDLLKDILSDIWLRSNWDVRTF